MAASLRCPDCGHDNDASEKFCDRCGASLSVVPDDELDSYPSPVEAGTVIEGRYQILTEIERGGMGVVYRAHDVTLDRKVAIKVLPEHFNQNPDVVARFKREARAMAQLDHANIVPIYAVGVHDRCHYFAMKYLEGRTVADELKVMRERGGPFFDQGTVLHVMAEVARGLVHAHHRGLVHRDIKPSNIMVAPDGHVTIMDFGIVKAQAGGAPLTRAGVVFGTPEYMAPEQAQGTAAPEPTTDLYALGIVAYEMLVGEPPFHGPTPLEVVLKHIQEEPVPIARRRPDVDLDLQSIIFRMIAKVPQARFQTGHELLSALATVHLAPVSSQVRRRSVTLEVDLELPSGERSRVAPASGLPAPLRMRESNPGQVGPGDDGRGSLDVRPGRYERVVTRSEERTDDPTRPDAARPDAARTEAARTDAARPEAARPDAARTEAARPDAARPEAARPDAAHPEAARPGRTSTQEVLRSPWLYVAAAAMVLAAAVVLAFALHRPAPAAATDAEPDAEALDAAPPTAPATEAPATVALPKVAVQIHLKTVPAAALVFTPDQPEPIGTTPFLMVQPPNVMTRDLVLRMPGFEDLRVTVSFMENREYLFELVPKK